MAIDLAIWPAARWGAASRAAAPAVVIALGILLLGGIGDAIRARKQAVEMIEATVFRKDHDDGLDFGEIGCQGRRAGGRDTRCGKQS